MGDQAYTVEQYLLGDYDHTLFPLTTTRFFVERFSTELKDFIYNRLLSNSATLPGFPVQQRCYAAKKGYNLRRTVKLDPAAEFFVYDVVFRNKKYFRRDFRPQRKSYGYRFSGGHPQATTEAYAAFKAGLAGARAEYPATLKVDVATYFNAIYHHDLVHSVRDLGWSEPDVGALGRFLREANAGRSVDCLPQGIHPTKVLGAEFLRFVDNSYRTKAALGLRFLDDIHLFDSDEGKLTSDLVTLQELLGEKGLSINDAKTALGPTADVDIPAQVDAIKQSLLRIRRETIVASGGSLEVSRFDVAPLSGEQTEYLLNLLETPDIEESDAELVLVLLHEQEEQVLSRIQDLLSKYPGLTKNLYNYARFAKDTSSLQDVVAGFIARSPLATEYQLFWLIKLTEDFLSGSPKYGEILAAAMDHTNATVITRAKVLEIDDKRFGLPERRDEVLRSGASAWEAWAAAVGMRGERAPKRNHLLAYFAKSSPLNGLIAECLRSLP